MSPSFVVAGVFMKSRLSLFSILLALSASPSAFADALYPVGAVVSVKWGNPLFPNGSVDVRGISYGTTARTYRSGIFGLQYDEYDPAGPSGFLPLKGICIDASQSLFGSGVTQLYYIQSLASFGPGDAIQPHSTHAPALDSAKKKLLQQLFTVAYPHPTSEPATAVDSAALQWSAWEIGGEALSPLNLNDGDVKISTTTNATVNEVRSRANQYLSQITAGTAETDLLIWSPVSYNKVLERYVRVAGQELLTLAHTPEPAHFAIPVLGMLAFVLRRRAIR